MSALQELAAAAGLSTRWIDWQGVHREVRDDTLHAVLNALGYRAEDEAACERELLRLAAERAAAVLPPMLVVRAGAAAEVGQIADPAQRVYVLTLEDGTVLDGVAEAGDDGICRIALFAPIGYHRLAINGQHLQLAIVPPRAFTVQDLAGDDEAQLLGIPRKQRAEVRRGLGNGLDISIRPNEANQQLHAYAVLPEPTKIISFEPHLHAPGNRMCLEAIWGYNIQTLSCVGYDHNWVRGYSYSDDTAPLLPRARIDPKWKNINHYETNAMTLANSAAFAPLALGSDYHSAILAGVAIGELSEDGGAARVHAEAVAALGGNLEIISRARIEIEAMRLMVLKAAKAMDVLGNKEARVWVSMVKSMIPEITCRIIDEAIQVHGATGISQWTPLAELYADVRHLRFADGPDEVHHMVVSRAEIKKYEPGRNAP